MSDSQKQEKIECAKSLVPFLQLEFTLRVFGHVIFHKVYPPKSQSL